MISDLILIAKKFSVPSAYGRRDGVRDFFAQYPDGVYIATDAGAPAGWEGYAVWFGGTGERYAERFMELIRDGYIVERFLRARVGGLLVFTFRCRLKMRRFGTLGKPNIDWSNWDGLLFTAVDGPAKIGMVFSDHTPGGTGVAKTIEYSIDGANTWTAFTTNSENRYFVTLAKGQSVAIRGNNDAYGYWNGSGDYFFNRYIMLGTVAASGNINSMLTGTPSDFTGVNECAFIFLFRTCGDSLVSIPRMPAKTLLSWCYYQMYRDCTRITTVDGFDAEVCGTGSCRYMFRGCTNLNNVTAKFTDISAYVCIDNWLQDVSPTGDFYCPDSLTIPTGASGIPSGWTRHDI